MSSTFLSTPSARRATYFPTPYDCSGQFLSTPSARRATDIDDAVAALTGFLSTPSARRATPSGGGFGGIHTRFLSTPSARRATSSRDFLYSSMSISIHALREEGDPECLLSGCAEKNFYPRPPRGGRRPSFSSPRIRKRFLSTPSARRATELRRQHRLPTPNFYPRPPRGGRRRNPAPQPREAHFYPRPPRGGRPQATPSASDRLISIHALREEGDPLYPACGSRSSKISIHALREEGDTYRWSALKKPRYFYPRPPRGGRHILQSYPQKTALFLSTPSARRATRIENKPVWRSHNFYPRPPRGGRPQKHVQMGVKRVISIHALREEGDDEPEGLTNKKNDFYPRPPRGGRPRASFSSSFWI